MSDLVLPIIFGAMCLAFGGALFCAWQLGVFK